MMNGWYLVPFGLPSIEPHLVVPCLFISVDNVAQAPLPFRIASVQEGMLEVAIADLRRLILRRGCTGIPSLLILLQHRLIIIQWWPSRAILPSLRVIITVMQRTAV